MTKIESFARKLVERKMGLSAAVRIDAQEDGSFEVFGTADNKHFLRVGKIGLRKDSALESRIAAQLTREKSKTLSVPFGYVEAAQRLLSSGADKKFPDSLWMRGVGEAVTGKARVSIRKEGENTISFSFEIPWSASFRFSRILPESAHGIAKKAMKVYGEAKFAKRAGEEMIYFLNIVANDAQRAIENALKVSFKDDGHNSPPTLSMSGADVFLKGGMYRVKGSAKVPKKVFASLEF